MKICGANTSDQVFNFLKGNFLQNKDINSFNKYIYNIFKIKDFCTQKSDYNELIEAFKIEYNAQFQEDRIEYGDFQTPLQLAKKTCYILKNTNPSVCVEPTCGKGNFIISSLECFQSLDYIYGVEIYKPYTWETKFNIIQFYLNNPQNNQPEIQIFHQSIFDFDFQFIAQKHSKEEFLLIGNPPWVTNSKLGQLASDNLPKKSNFKKLNGYEALTGKSNFDIAEFILIQLFRVFEKENGIIAFLVKNSVIKNIIKDSQKKEYKISDFKQYTFDSKKEFNVNVEASVFSASLNKNTTSKCNVFNINQPEYEIKRFGWHYDNFVSNVQNYELSEKYDGKFPFTWRSGVKHDCTKVFELKRINGHYFNKFNETLEIEDDLIFPLVKSSQLKHSILENSENYVIITQRKIGQETSSIKAKFPKLYQYLESKKTLTDNRKSSIYKGKPAFSMFGIGDYTFKRYKIAISGLYKKAHFALLIPQDEKPLIADDTCYTIGFDNLKFAVIIAYLLNSERCMKFLESITFKDAKRVYTKDILMRIDLEKLLKDADDSTIFECCNITIKKVNPSLSITFDDITEFRQKFVPKKETQMTLFS